MYKFAVACNRFFKKDDETQKEVSSFEITAWSWLAEVCGEYLKKGRGVRVVGQLKQDRWTSADGEPRSRIEIVAEHVEFKPPLKKQDEDGKDGEEKAEAVAAEEPAAEERAQEESELKEAANF